MRTLLPLLLLLSACREHRDGSPEEAYADFARAVHQGDSKGAYALLSTQSHQAIEQNVRALSEASKGAVREDPALITFGTGAKVPPLNEVKLLKRDGERAEVEAVAAGGRAMRVALVQEAGRWKVDLSEHLKK